ncbi:MAG: hypothetical protein QOE88_1944 [Verrucomicrobiota bacterium]|nr:hypothetical protein [Verrucomicrobiota bacterium]
MSVPISIIVPMKNEESNLERCLRACLESLMPERGG